MKTLTLTEFNQNPSRATRLADDDEVLILRRGLPAYRLVRAVDESGGDPVEALLASGLLSPARGARRAGGRRVARTEHDLGAALDADRERLDG